MSCAYLSDTPSCSILDWLEGAYERLDVEGWEFLLTHLWNIWGVRNKLVMAVESEVPSDVCGYATKICTEARGEGDSMVLKPKGGVADVIAGVSECPQAGWVKCNVNASVKET